MRPYGQSGNQPSSVLKIDHVSQLWTHFIVLQIFQESWIYSKLVHMGNRSVLKSVFKHYFEGVDLHQIGYAQREAVWVGQRA
jgi:hypothetical protein